MIHFFALEPEVVGDFLDSWAPGLRGLVDVRRYSRLFPDAAPAEGLCVLVDFERMNRWRFQRTLGFAGKLRTANRAMLNDPARWKSRLDLLNTLRERGINRFRAFRLDALDAGVRFPVFLRSARDHRGAVSGLLHSREELERAVSALSLKQRLRKRRLLVIEYCDCSDEDGLFRKYSAMKVGGTIIPRHVLFSRKWVTKKPDVVSDATVEEERDFLQRFPHREQIEEVFRVGGVEYGRVDYGVKDGRVQVWEINTNPVVVPRRDTLDPKRLELQSRSAEQIAEALRALATGSRSAAHRRVT
ncbi:MAG TPA: hypothetical protein GYA07_00085 [Verrucomicrobia bacterium]|nr:hypothetical protein [Verrucomicrobiota bacterium]HOB31413.1 hypothetical protein [Verrucomicrobiota bacterium]HOP96329.1 hypothetical protein [Verrucomicrobiota bacterium]